MRVSDLSHAERFKAVRVSGGDQFLRAHDKKRVTALDAFHGLLYRFFDRRGFCALFCYEISDDLRVDRRLEECAFLFEFASQCDGIGKVAVMGKGKRSFDVLGNKRLGIFQDTCAGRGISDMADRDRAFQGIDDVVREHLGNEAHVLLAADPPVVIDGDAAAFLASVLESKKTIVYERRDLQSVSVKDTEYAAFFVSGTDHSTSPSFSEIIL